MTTSTPTAAKTATPAEARRTSASPTGPAARTSATPSRRRRTSTRTSSSGHAGRRCPSTSCSGTPTRSAETEEPRRRVQRRRRATTTRGAARRATGPTTARPGPRSSRTRGRWGTPSRGCPLLPLLRRAGKEAALLLLLGLCSSSSSSSSRRFCRGGGEKNSDLTFFVSLSFYFTFFIFTDQRDQRGEHRMYK